MEWIFIDQSLPNDGDLVVGWCTYPAGESARWVTYKDGTFWFNYDAGPAKKVSQNVTAWFYLHPPVKPPTIEQRLKKVEDILMAFVKP